MLTCDDDALDIIAKRFRILADWQLYGRMLQVVCVLSYFSVIYRLTNLAFSFKLTL
jgi:hypothetical protein